MSDLPGTRLVREAVEIRVRAAKLEAVLVGGLGVLLLVSLAASLKSGLAGIMASVLDTFGRVAGG